ncbi:TD and POZ domain-containing protein 3 [Nephila pilipes]|uniref:TD and POZ domain-containing protein 3 n=1 Tax=Nephila pilipes TaxID=299642 RepID=A0A8X6Q7J9_NEPPI|nr:TD and POZ domain-containing protein 3 [Nephila pilipes]
MAFLDHNTKSACTFLWKIKNFNCLWLKRQERIGSPEFVVETLENTRWKLVVYPRGDRKEDEIAFGLQRSEDDSHIHGIEVYIELAFLSENGSILSLIRSAKNTVNKLNIKRSECFEKQENVYVARKSEFLPFNTLTARCKIWRCDGKLSIDEYFLARTSVAVEQRSFEWKIEQFSTIKAYQKKNLVIRSIANEALLTFFLYLTGGRSCKEVIDINVHVFDPRARYIFFKLFISDKEGKFENCGEKEMFIDRFGKIGTLSLLFSKKDLIENKEKYLINDVLNLYCECTISTGIASETTEKIDLGMNSLTTALPVVQNLEGHTLDDVKNVYEHPTDIGISLREDVGFLCCSDVLSDMKLCTNSNSIPVHTQILGARSPVFRAMFTNEMKERTDGFVDVTDLDEDTVRQMLQYMYTDMLENLQWESASQLYAAADKYDITSLRNKCCAILKAELQPTNACQILTLADQHQDEVLKKDVLNYIIAQGKTIFSSEEWKLLMETHIQLAAETMYENCNRD